ncbi:hypothetical protein [Cellulomonas cellasea]|uniref:Uncharacterized protein n=2 Tax=Cellulomonas cellasea TaxID=43670 RepID=A0A0A0B7U7_9CELL|nr:hypothetical protein [Cellulomonas cellasea]KGM01316.1 hypothetical protein Q760_02175 [Cellulomonas cellasea DSM 20118]GEA87383.1 hypothetical protein CCE01nite_13320 [Cellulomonas cellasea]
MTVVEVVAAASGGLSALTALVAVAVAVRSDRRSREIARVAIFLNLRDGFRDIYRELGDLRGADDPGAPLRLARESYWHHAFDEWFVPQLAPRECGDLWSGLFRTMVVSGYGHAPLRQVLDDLMAEPDKGFGAYAGAFADEVRKVAAEHARRFPADHPPA